jgi:hypothetical protein
MTAEDAVEDLPLLLEIAADRIGHQREAAVVGREIAPVPTEQDQSLRVVHAATHVLDPP